MSISKDTPRRCRQSGYTILMVVFLVATILILATAVAPNLLTLGRRERETETIWRGEQYKRAIGLYFRKFGKYPTKVEDLTAETNGVRFLRHAFTEPLNKEDGSWRFIYVGPSGELIGSLRRTSLLQNVQSAPPPSGTLAGASAQNSMESQPRPLEGSVIGGNIVGVASKIKESSLRVYDGGDRYELWEFIWSSQNGQILQPPTPVQATPGTTQPPPA